MKMPRADLDTGIRKPNSAVPPLRFIHPEKKPAGTNAGPLVELFMLQLSRVGTFQR